MIFLRIAVSVVFFLSIFFFPWYVSMLLGLVLMIHTNAYEVIFGGLLLDFLYSTEGGTIFFLPYFFTVTFLFLFILISYLKKELVFYTDRIS